MKIPDSGLTKGLFPPVSLTLEDLKKSKFCPNGKCHEEFYYCIVSYINAIEMGHLGNDGYCNLEKGYILESERKWRRKISFKKLEKLLENYPEKGTRPIRMNLIILSESPEPEKDNIIGPFLFKTDHGWHGDI